MQIIMFCPKTTFTLIIHIFTYFKSLSQTTIDIFDSSLTLAIVYNHLDLDDFIREKYEPVHIRFNSDVVGGLHTCATSFASHWTSEIELLVRQPTNRLTHYRCQFSIFIIRFFVFFNWFHIWNSLRFHWFQLRSLFSFGSTYFNWLPSACPRLINLYII